MDPWAYCFKMIVLLLLLLIVYDNWKDKARHNFFLSGEIRAGIHLTDASKFHKASYYSQIYTKYKGLSTEGIWSQGMNLVSPHWNPFFIQRKKKKYSWEVENKRKFQWRQNWPRMEFGESTPEPLFYSAKKKKHMKTYSWEVENTRKFQWRQNRLRMASYT